MRWETTYHNDGSVMMTWSNPTGADLVLVVQPSGTVALCELDQSGMVQHTPIVDLGLYLHQQTKRYHEDHRVWAW